MIVGWLAQSWKGRTGATWGFMTFLVMIPTWLVLYFGTVLTRPGLNKTDEEWYAFGSMVSGAVAVLMALIVATLPKREAARAFSDNEKAPILCGRN